MDKKLVETAREYVTGLLKEHLPENMVYHSVGHTERVYDNVELIGRKEGLNEEELLIAKLAALFHDTGYIRSGEDHENISAEMAEHFLLTHHVEPGKIRTITGAIRSTRIPQDPGDKISEVLCDADLMHLACDDYFKQVRLMIEELRSNGDEELTERKMHEKSLSFFENHRYHTEYGKKVLKPKKKINENLIRERLMELSSV